MKYEMPSFPKVGFDINSIQKQVNIDNEEITRSLKDVADEREKRYNDGVEREQKMIELLESINKNTSLISDILKLMEENTKDQKIILEIINEFNSLATISNKNDGHSLYRKIMQKINTTISDVNTINTLCVYGMTIYNTLHTMGKI